MLFTILSLLTLSKPRSSSREVQVLPPPPAPRLSLPCWEITRSRCLPPTSLRLSLPCWEIIKSRCLLLLALRLLLLPCWETTKSPWFPPPLLLLPRCWGTTRSRSRQWVTSRHPAQLPSRSGTPLSLHLLHHSSNNSPIPLSHHHLLPRTSCRSSSTRSSCLALRQRVSPTRISGSGLNSSEPTR